MQQQIHIMCMNNTVIGMTSADGQNIRNYWSDMQTCKVVSFIWQMRLGGDMMIFRMKSKVMLYGMECTHEHEQEFDDNSNVFGRVLEYHQYMERTFPNMPFKLISAEQLEEGKHGQ